MANLLEQKKCTTHIYQTGRSNGEHEPCVKQTPKSGVHPQFMSEQLSTPCISPTASDEIMIELSNQFARLELKIANIPDIAQR